MISYAQNYEDIFLYRCFSNRSTGTYIDVGASCPVLDNVSFLFYKEGWSGLNVEPIPERFSELEYIRSRDINIKAVVGNCSEPITFIRTPGLGGTSTVLKTIAEGYNLPDHECAAIECEQKTLKDLCMEYKLRDVQFLKIDVEGAERQVLEGMDFSFCSPEVLVIEAVQPMSDVPSWGAWEDVVINENYTFAFFDGLNRYYVHNDFQQHLKAFKSPITPLDNAVQLKHLGNPLQNNQHPNYWWALSFCSNLLKATSVEDTNRLCEVLCLDVPPEVLISVADEKWIAFAFNRVYGRDPSSTELEKAQQFVVNENINLKEYLLFLLKSEEFLMARGICGI